MKAILPTPNEYLLQHYNDARLEGNEIKCFTGLENKYRIIERNSNYLTVSDLSVLLKNCIYPIYLSGQIKIKEETEHILLKLANSENPFEFYTAINFINHEWVIKDSYIVPFEINFKNTVKTIMDRFPAMKKHIQKYNGLPFNREYVMLEIVEDIMKQDYFTVWI
ncbi:MAG: hypothetical protein IJ305_05090 [Oscillospiraceae bacterium]|nr:hypothetical protein [Oscillospiraceae bacterium]